MTQEDLLALLQEDKSGGLPDFMTSPDEMMDPMYHLSKLLSGLSGVGSIPDVMYNTNNPGDVLTAIPRYLLNIGKGVGGMLPFVDAPEFKGAQDVMEKHGITTGNEIGDFLMGFGGDVLTDPLTYAGGFGIGKGLTKTLGGKSAGQLATNSATKLPAIDLRLKQLIQQLEGVPTSNIMAKPKKGSMNMLVELLKKGKGKGNITGSVVKGGLKNPSIYKSSQNALLDALINSRNNYYGT